MRLIDTMVYDFNIVLIYFWNIEIKCLNYLLR